MAVKRATMAAIAVLGTALALLSGGAEAQAVNSTYSPTTVSPYPREAGEPAHIAERLLRFTTLDFTCVLASTKLVALRDCSTCVPTVDRAAAQRNSLVYGAWLFRSMAGA